MHITRYLELIARIGYFGVKSKKLVKELSKEWGCSRRQVYYYIAKLKEEGLIRIRRYDDGKYVEATPKLKRWLAKIEIEYPAHFIKQYIKRGLKHD